MTHRVSVMLVDDVEVERMLIRMLLERSGRFVVVAEAADGIQALERAADADPDVIVLDLSMPRMDGLEALPRLRAAVPGARVVVMSGFSADQQSSRVLDLGAHSYLEKGTPAQAIIDHLLDAAGERSGEGDEPVERGEPVPGVGGAGDAAAGGAPGAGVLPDDLVDVVSDVRNLLDTAITHSNAAALSAAIAREVVDLVGGRVVVDAPGDGSTRITLTLPPAD